MYKRGRKHKFKITLNMTSDYRCQEISAQKIEGETNINRYETEI